LAADPFDYWECPIANAGDLNRVAVRLDRWATVSAPGLPPFQGGAAGVLGYALGQALETLPRPAYDEFQTPALALGWYDVVLAWDHAAGSGWIISQGLPELEPRARRRRAAARLEQFRQSLAEGRERPASGAGCATGPMPPAPIHARQLAPRHPVAGPDGLTSNFSQAEYLRAAERAIRYVFDGDIFQVNLAQRLLLPARADASELYLRLRERNPAPMAGYFDLGAFQIVSASPERFLRVEDRRVETRPIKGTRRRTGDSEEDLRMEAELANSAKDRAENVMIVDLSRNDLSRACRPESVRVERLCGLERYPFVMHLVSVITGRLADGACPVDLVRAAFPGGSITGAPKVRAMEIIAELEPTARGPYCGSLGYFGVNGSMDLSILIRTITAGRGWWQIPVGGAIVAQSDPRQEYEETWHKAEGMLQAIGDS
ncbi:MAG: anthranilate synthase component I family protein, partial [Patescibacteria group bacterium]|nr:anthranilate synthase component I family protein [Patescibacteria group bacterium]